MGGSWHFRGTILPLGDVRDVFVTDGAITFVPQTEYRTLIEDCYLLPGLVDAHAHLALASPVEGSAPERVRASARAHLEAGVLLVREPGGPDRCSLGLGPHEGLPRVVTGGCFLAPPGGYFPGLAREVSEDELPGAAAEEAQASGAWAKVIGDFLGPDMRLRTNWSTDVLAEAARRVHAAGARITVLAILPETVEQAIEAGFDAVEHGMGVGDDHARAMAAADIALVPTLFPPEMGVAFVNGLGLSPADLVVMSRLFDEHGSRALDAARLGVRVFAGTDAGMGPHGQIAGQVQLMIDAGFTAGEALAAASWEARAWLGLPTIEEGAPADLIAFRDDPRSGADALRDPAVIVLDGRIVRPVEVTR
jgi:imidazolonepropionase-like amidohydrolase